MDKSGRKHLKRKAFFAATLAASLMVGANSARATAKVDDNSLIEGAKLCTKYLPRHEREYGIPVHLLAAIASTESGRFHKALGLNLPWPWTINVEGTGYFFDSKQEAINAVKLLQARGIQSIDVGCMQVNLHHHPGAFASLDQAFDPAYNVAYAAQFLKQNFLKEGSWRTATADYHSHTPAYGQQYASLVFNAWGRIVNKVADARAGRLVINQTPGPITRLPQPVIKIGREDSQVEANNAPSPVTLVPPAIHRHRPALRTAHRELPLASPSRLHMREITIGRDTTRERGVLVIRPHHDEGTSSAQAKSEEEVAARAQVIAQGSQPMSATAAPLSAQAPAEAPPVLAAQPVAAAAQPVKPAAKGQFAPEHAAAVPDYSPSAGGQHPAKNIFVFDN